MPTIDNVGSASRDFCMLERNLLALLKLGELVNLLPFITFPNHFFKQLSCFHYYLRVFYFERVFPNLPTTTIQHMANPRQVFLWP